MKKILVTRSSMPSLDEYIAEIKDIWDSHWLTNMGSKHQVFQAELKKYMKELRLLGIIRLIYYYL